MLPCDKGEILATINTKMDRALDAITALAVQTVRIDQLENTAGDHEKRIRVVEGAPAKLLWASVGGIGSLFIFVVGGFLLYVFGAR